MEILLNNDIPLSSWKDLLERSPHATPFQTPNFYSLLNSVEGYSAQAIAITHNGIVIALAVITIQKETGLKGYFSKRGIIYGGALIDPKFPESIQLLINQVSIHLSKSVIYLEIRNYSNYNYLHSYYQLDNWKFIPYLNCHIDLKDKTLDQLYNNMNYNRRRQIQTSINQGAFYEECSTIDDLTALYDILSELYKNRVKLPLPPFEFFKSFYEQNFGKIFIVKHNNFVIGGSICPILLNKSIFTFYYCGLRYYNKKIFPTHMAIIAAAEFGINNKLKVLDFMGAGKKNEEYGVRKYKQEFGGIINEQNRYLKIYRPFLYRLGIFALKIKKKVF